MLSCNEPLAGLRRNKFHKQMSNHVYTTYINESTATDPEMRVAQGHISIWKQAFAHEDQWCIVLEDDAKIYDLSLPIFDDGIMFISLFSDGIKHREHYDFEFDIIKPNHGSMNMNCGLVGYCINTSYAVNIAESYRYDVPIDHYVYNITQDNQLVTKENKVTHMNGWSLKSKSLV